MNPDAALFAEKNVVPKYNGNIAEVDWRAVEQPGTYPSLTPKRYGYAYDGLNRLQAGYYQNPNNPNSKENIESIAYDTNGNILNLYRTAPMVTGMITPPVIDNLSYTYTGNRLTKITDSAANPSGYEGGGNTISYDTNGNMKSMLDKGIQSIAYNYLNLPNAMNINEDTNKKLFYTYNAQGNKLRKIFNYKTTTVIIDYLDGFQYLSNNETLPSDYDPVKHAYEQEAFIYDILQIRPEPTLQFFPTSEGFYDFEKNQYIYQYKDHLGNTRVSFGRNSAGILEIIDNNDYYPFGMNHLNLSNTHIGIGSYVNYKYNGKELQETGMYDYGARFYMPDIGRWGVVDPLAEKYPSWSPYVYTLNNPIKYIDPDGMQVWPPEEGEDGQTWSDSDGDFVNRNGTWYKDNGGFYGVLCGDCRYASVDTRNPNGTPGYDGKTMLPSSSYDYTYELMPGKEADDINYWQNGESGVMASRFLETTGRDATAEKNRTTAIETVVIVATTPRGGGGMGRAGKQARLRELSNDPKLGRADRGWLKQEINQINRGKRTNIRNPPGKDLAHERGREAAKGYSYKHSNLQNRKDHRNQHKYDNGGRKNKERPIK